MVSKLCVRVVLLAVCLILTYSGSLAPGADFDLSIVIQPGMTIDGFTVVDFDNESRPPVINSSGEVLAQIELDGTGHALVTTQRVVATAGTLVGGVPILGLDEEDPSFALNGAGQAVFSVGHFPEEENGRTAVALDNLLVATAGSMIGGETVDFVSFDVTAINDAGDVVFKAFVGGGTEVLATQDAIVARAGDAINGMTVGGVFGTGLINNVGGVAFESNALDGPTLHRIIAVDNQVAVRSGDEVDGVTLSGNFRLLALGDDGAVVFNHGTVEGVVTVFRQDELLATLAPGDIIDGQQLLGLSPRGVVANAAGDVAFLGSLLDGAAVFAGTHLVAKTGDLIDGQTLSSVIGSPAINDRGDLVFMAEFEDGSWGVVTATVPEGGTLGLMIAGLAVFISNVRRRRR